MTFFNGRSESKTNTNSYVNCKRLDVVHEQNSLKIAWDAIERKYGIVLGGFLKTRHVDREKNNDKFSLNFKSKWKLRYWRLSLSDEGLIFEKSRRADSKPYKSILLPFGKTLFWQNWGKRGDSKYRFGFTLRVTSDNMQMDVAVDSERIRSQWMNVLDIVFHKTVRHTHDLLECLVDKHCAVESISESYKRVEDDPHIIERRFPSTVYGNDGHISDNLENLHFFYWKDITLRRVFDQDFEPQASSKDHRRDKNEVSKASVMHPPLLNDCENCTGNSSFSVLPEVMALISGDAIDRVVHRPISQVKSESSDISHLVDLSLSALDAKKQKLEPQADCVEEKQQLLSPTPSASTLKQSPEILGDSNAGTQLKESD